VLTRRVFIKGATAVVCTCAYAVGAAGCGSKPTSDVPTAPDGSYRAEDGQIVLELPAVGRLAVVGGAVKFTVQQDGTASELKLIVLRAADEDYRAFADRCTHNGKELNYIHHDGILACCGLGSRFDLAGNVLRGPAEEPLARYTVRKQGDDLVIAT
jgi:Rieske Fe-S protein